MSNENDNGSNNNNGGNDGQGTAVAILQRQVTQLEKDVDEREAENKQLRDQRRDLRSQVKDLETKVPEEGSVLLSADEASAFEAYKLLGKPEDVKSSLDEANTVRRKAEVAKVAKVAGFNADVLSDLAPETAVLSVKTTTDGDGEPTSNAFIKVDEKGDEVPLTQFAEDNWKLYLPSLRQEGSNTSSNQQNLNNGTRYVRQSPPARPPAPKELTPEELVEQKAKSAAYHTV